MDPTDERRSQPPPEARGEADLASTTEFRAFLAGEPIPTGTEPRSRAARSRPDGLLARLRTLFQGRSAR
jgi:hypothetical protein